MTKLIQIFSSALVLLVFVFSENAVSQISDTNQEKMRAFYYHNTGRLNYQMLQLDSAIVNLEKAAILLKKYEIWETYTSNQIMLNMIYPCNII